MLRLLSTALLLLAAGCVCSAQSTDTSQQQAPPPPVAPTAATPQIPATTPPATAGDANAKKPKKVWTNENMSDVQGPVSVVGNGKNSGKAKPSGVKTADAGYIANTKKQLEKLEQQLVDADKQVAKLKDFKAGEPVGGDARQFHKGYNSEPIDLQIQALETKKAETQDKINALLDEARKKGVEPGQLR
jgi:hypothetical protein